MFGRPIARRLSQRTSTTSRLNHRAWSPSAPSLSRTVQRWQHSGATIANGEGATTMADSAKIKQTPRSIKHASDGESHAAFAPGMMRSPPPNRQTTNLNHWLRRRSRCAGKPGGGWTLRRGVFYVMFGLGFGAVGAYGSWHTLKAQGLGFYSDEESLKRFTPEEANVEARRIEDTINNLPLVAEQRQRSEMVESRPHLKMPGQYRAHSLTGSALAGPGKVPVPAYAWLEKGGKSLVSVVYVGEELCGHPGIVHGGFLATMLDEGLARCCFAALPHNIGVTANLNINYRKPTPAGSYLVLRAETTKVEGRKAWVKGHIESVAAPGETPTVYADATALFVSPKFAAMMPKIN
ncbi:hypothetical protein ED733_004645 [Metarhizium rileyi]|uniref:Thioesterase domain-containing protein n=1 Tax=Metarhizium rileyi (strain RCEF 4871) TaxID=1649241 RepID=A0A5C6GHJ5_METRR|nr:hypothetical protein ED733_004645 [Metarhizium rileyi]